MYTKIIKYEKEKLIKNICSSKATIKLKKKKKTQNLQHLNW